MALRPRNIALEGFAHDFYPPAMIAARGFAVDEEEDEGPIGNGSGARARFLYQRPLRPSTPVMRVVTVSARGESPVPTDEADLHVAPVERLKLRARPPAAVAVSGTTPVPSDGVRIAVGVTVSARGESPVPVDVGRLVAPCGVEARGETPMPCDAAAAIMDRPRDPSLLAFRERTPDGRRDFRADFISARSGRSLLPRERQSFAMGPSCLR